LKVECAICNKRLSYFSDEMVKGGSGEWVCRQCLDKAHITPWKFRSHRIYSSNIRDYLDIGKPIEAKVSGAQIGVGCLVSFIVLAFFLFFALLIMFPDSSSSRSTTTTETAQTEQAATDQTEQVIPPEVEIIAANVHDGILGTPVMTITVDNVSNYTIDAFDYEIEAYNAYGEKVTSSLLDTFTHQGESLRAGNRVEIEAPIPSLRASTTYRVALTRWHIQELDETVKTSSKERIWIKAGTN